MKRRDLSFRPGQYVINFENPEDSIMPDAPDDPEKHQLCEPEPKGDVPVRQIHFISFGSGSSGNCSYIATSRGGILIDAGVRPDHVEASLMRYGIGMDSVKAIVLTHDHTDHVKFAYQILRNYKNIRLFCTNRVMNGLLRRHSISKRIKEYHSPIFKEIPFKLFDFEVTAFDVPHDGTDNMGFSFLCGDRRFVIATDLGEVTERARHYMSLADWLVIESNYDSRMLEEGKYPLYLKARIRTSRGHLDNVDTAAFLREIASERLKYVFLCHLSADNNTPEKALAASRAALEEAGLKVGTACETLSDREADIQLTVLPRFEASRRYIFR